MKTVPPEVMLADTDSTNEMLGLYTTRRINIVNVVYNCCRSSLVKWPRSCGIQIESHLKILRRDQDEDAIRVNGSHKPLHSRILRKGICSAQVYL